MENRVKTLQELADADEAVNLDQIDPALMTLNIKIRGDHFDSSITGEVAKAIGELQASLYRAAAEILHGTPNINLLTASERSKLEFSVIVSPGCTDLKIDGKEFLKTILEKAIEKMEPKHIVIVLVFAIVAFTLDDSVSKWIQAWKENEVAKSFVDHAQVLTKPLSDAMKSSADKLAKSAHSADSVKFGGREYSSEDINTLNQRSARQMAQFETYTGEFFVKGVSEVGTELKVDLMEVSTQEVYTVIVPESSLFEQEMPKKPTQFASLMESGQIVSVTFLVKETKAKTDRLLVSLEATSDVSTPVNF